MREIGLPDGMFQDDLKKGRYFIILTVLITLLVHISLFSVPFSLFYLYFHE